MITQIGQFYKNCENLNNSLRFRLLVNKSAKFVKARGLMREVTSISPVTGSRKLKFAWAV